MLVRGSSEAKKSRLVLGTYHGSTELNLGASLVSMEAFTRAEDDSPKRQEVVE